MFILGPHNTKSIINPEMKKIIVVIIVAVMAMACTQQKGFKIDVNLEGAEGLVKLENRVSGNWITVDSAEVVDGVAVLTGEVQNPEAHYISVEGQRSKAIVFVENASISVTGKADSLNFAEVAGSATHSEYETVNAKTQEITTKYMALYQEARSANAAGDTAKGKNLMDQVNNLYESIGVMQEKFITDNPASYVSPYFISRVQYSKEVEELEKMVSALDPKLSSVQTVIELKEKIAKLKTVTVGKIAPDFSQNDSEGNAVKFSEIYSKNELTLLDFWASWCGPCRRENPNVVSVYNEFKNDGFSVFGVSLDKDKDKWLEAVEKDQLTWEHVSDLAYWQNAAAQLYAVNSIPSNLLIDKNGKIIAKNKREEELREAVAKYFESKP